MKKYIVPLILFIFLGLLLAYGLNLDPRNIPSPLIGKSLPAFSLPTVADPARRVSRDELKGRVYLLNVWAKLRLMKAMREKNPVEAFRDVRQLAKLVLSTDTDWYSAYRLLNIEKAAYDFMKTNGKNLKGWKTIPKDTRKQFYRSMAGFNFLMAFNVSQEALERLFNQPDKRVGYCNTVSWGLRMALSDRPLLQDAYPERFATLNRILTNSESVCRNNHWREAWRDPEFIPEMLRGWGIYARIKNEWRHNSDSTWLIKILDFFFVNSSNASHHMIDLSTLW